MFAKFGVTCTFNIEYIVMPRCFPTLFVATAMGFCNFLATISSACSYPISQMHEPAPMYLFTGLCTMTSLSCLFLKDRPAIKKINQEETTPEPSAAEAEDYKVL